MIKTLYLLPLIALWNCRGNTETTKCLIPLSVSRGISVEEGTAILNQWRQVGKIERLTIYRDTILCAAMKFDNDFQLSNAASLELCTGFSNKAYVSITNEEGSRFLGGADTVIVKPCKEAKGQLLDSTSVQLLDSLIRHTKTLMRKGSHNQKQEKK